MALTTISSKAIQPVQPFGLLIPNLNPAVTQMLSRSINFQTLDLSTTPNTYISEGYLVVPKFAVTAVSGGISITKKFVLLFGNTGYGLKFALPQVNDNTMYITYCFKNSQYEDGYQDYVTTVDAAYVSSFVTWAQNYQVPVVPSGGNFSLGASKVIIVSTTSELDLNFNVVGRVTSDINTTRLFTVRMAYYIDGTISGGQVSPRGQSIQSGQVVAPGTLITAPLR